jgi:hypothetical protein
MGEQFLFDYFGIPVAFWIVLYISDYYLTLWGARLYVTGGNKHLAFDGSHELNPAFEQDINYLRRVSLRFVMALFVYTFIMLVVRGLARDLPFLFSMFAGALILIEVCVHVRHVRNIVALWHMRQDIGVAGRLEYQRWYTLRTSAIDVLVFAIFFTGVALIGGGWFFAGGALACLGVSFRHWRASRRLLKTTQKG